MSTIREQLTNGITRSALERVYVAVHAYLVAECAGLRQADPATWNMAWQELVAAHDAAAEERS